MIDSGPWFRFSDQPPPVAVRVRVQWDGREFVAARAPHPQTGKDVWGEYKMKPNGKPSADATPVRLRGEPELWSPLHAELWKGRLPEPVIRSSAGRFVSERVQFTLVDDAEASDLAREMESERAHLNCVKDADDATPSRGASELQPWRNIYRVSYARPIEPTELCGEARVMRALCYDRLIKVGHRAIKTNAGSVAAYGRVSDVPAAEDLTHDWRPPFQPDPRDIRDYEDVISPAINEYGWSRKEEDILRSRAIDPPFSFKELGDHYRKSGEWARQAYWGAIQGICSAANGVVFSNARAKLERVQEGNRRAKREARA